MIRFKSRILATEKAKILYDKLFQFSNDENWILGTLDNMTEEQMQELEEMLEIEDITTQDIDVFSLKCDGIIGTPMDDYDGDGSDIINYDDYLEYLEEKKQKELDK